MSLALTSNGAHPPELDARPIVDAALAELPRLRSGPNPPRYIAQLDAAFERAADAVLADPALAERSRRLRGIARRVVPMSLRPAARRLAESADDAARRWPILLRIGRELAELADGVVSDLVALEEPARQWVRRADAAARANPVVYTSVHSVARLVERSAADDRLPVALRRPAQIADAAARRARSWRG